jgi:pimeloyl-ACP methyl ester carboxylesterase
MTSSFTTGTYRTNDDVTLTYRHYASESSSSSSPSPALVCIHGWSGSAEYFSQAIAHMSRDRDVFALNLRGHAGVAPGYGYTIARLAMDVREFLDSLAAADAPGGRGGGGYVLCGTSMGCAVIWSYLELFGDTCVRGVILVDQAPLQDKRPGWELGSNGCYDAASYASLAAAVRADLDAFADGNADACLVSSKTVDSNVLATLKSETLTCDQDALCELMYDHTHQDWRRLCARTTVAALVIAGGKSKIFPVKGVTHVADLMQGATCVVYEDCDHWLYIEEPERFARDVESFMSSV